MKIKDFANMKIMGFAVYLACGLRWGKRTNQCIPLRNTLGSRVVVFCECEIIEIFFSVLCG